MKELRLAAIEVVLLTNDGVLTRSKLSEITGLGPAQVTREILKYREAFPDNLKLGQSKHYNKSDVFAPKLLTKSAQKELAQKGVDSDIYEAFKMQAQYNFLDAFIDANLLINKRFSNSDFPEKVSIATEKRAISRAADRLSIEIKRMSPMEYHGVSRPLVGNSVFNKVKDAKDFLSALELLTKMSRAASKNIPSND